jgi:hypothetical protein
MAHVGEPLNQTMDVYRAGNAPPAAPDVAGVPCRVKADYRRGLEAGEGNSAAQRFTHIALVLLGADVRDDYNLGTVGAGADTVFIPDRNGTPFKVIFVERRLRGTEHDHKRVYLARQTPPWPTDEV